VVAARWPAPPQRRRAVDRVQSDSWTETAGAVASSSAAHCPAARVSDSPVAAATAQSGAELDGVGVSAGHHHPQSRFPGRLSLWTRSTARRRCGGAGQRAATTAQHAPLRRRSRRPNLTALLEAALPASGEMPTNDRFSTTNRWQRLDYIHPNELIDQNVARQIRSRCSRRCASAATRAACSPAMARHPATCYRDVKCRSVRDGDGAHAAASTNEPYPPGVAGADRRTYAGGPQETGRVPAGACWPPARPLITWRAPSRSSPSRMLTVPGFDRLETVSAITQQVDAAPSSCHPVIRVCVLCRSC